MIVFPLLPTLTACVIPAGISGASSCLVMQIEQRTPRKLVDEQKPNQLLGCQRIRVLSILTLRAASLCSPSNPLRGLVIRIGPRRCSRCGRHRRSGLLRALLHPWPQFPNKLRLRSFLQRILFNSHPQPGSRLLLESHPGNLPKYRRKTNRILHIRL